MEFASCLGFARPGVFPAYTLLNIAPTESVSKYFYESTPIEKEKKLVSVFRDIRDYVSEKLDNTTLADVS